MKIISLVCNHFLVNTYIIYTDSKEAVWIDPACTKGEEEEKLIHIVTENKLDVKYILFTHTHIDHIAGGEFAKKIFPQAKLMMHADALTLYNHADNFSMVMGFDKQQLPEVDEFIVDSQLIALGNHTLKALLTPGHASGSMCYYAEKEGFVESGDVLFRDSIGRADLPGGNYDTLIQSIRTKLLTLPPQTKVFPGHGDVTTIGYEKDNNPFL